jgi:C_GCAxxG_C_C family probable redox protein
LVESISLPSGSEWIARVKEKSYNNMTRYDSCAQSILAAFMDELGIDDPLVIRAAGAMHGGMLCSLTCGIHTAGLMVLGLLVGREELDEGLDGLFPILLPGQELMRRLIKRIGSHMCREITKVVFTDPEQAMRFYSSKENEKCFRLVAEGAEEIALFLKELEEKGELFRT